RLLTQWWLDGQRQSQPDSARRPLSVAVRCSFHHLPSRGILCEERRIALPTIYGSEPLAHPGETRGASNAPPRLPGRVPAVGEAQYLKPHVGMRASLRLS